MANDTFHEGSLAGGSGGIEAILDTAIRAAEPQPIDTNGDLVSVVVPTNGRLELVDVKAKLAHHQAAPDRARGTYKAATVQSFIDFVTRHEDDGDTLTIWVHPTSGRIVAVLNDHGRDQTPQWGDHRVDLQLIVTDEWQRWTRYDGHFLGQQEFAEHLQDGLTEIAEPPGAELLEIAQTMQGSVGVTWKSKVSITDGSVQFGYVEEADAKAGRGDRELSVPSDFKLVLAPFVGEGVAELDAHLRWRMNNGQLKIGYRLDNPQRVVREALERIAARLADNFPSQVFLGEPRT